MPLPGNVGRIAHDPVADKHYGIQGHDVVEIDMANKSVRKMDLGPEVPELSWPSDLAFDTGRQRLLLKSSGGGGYLYAYSPAEQAWTVVLEKPGVDLIAYHPRLNALFGIALPYSEHGSRPVLVRFNQHGAVVQSTALGEPIVAGSVGGGPGIPTSQLVAVDDYLVLLTASDPHRSPDRSRLNQMLYLIEPNTGRVTLTWRQTISE